jgi:hypothetical protein
MRQLVLLVTAVAAAVVVGTAGATGPTAGTLSVEGGRGVVTLELRGSMLGLLANGSLRVTDLTPKDRYAPIVTGRKLVQLRVGPRTTVFRGQGLRFRMLGGSYRIVVRGGGIALSGVGWGWVTLDGEPRFAGDDTGVYAVDGTDCSADPLTCAPIPEVPLRIKLGTPASEGSFTLTTIGR